MFKRGYVSLFAILAMSFVFALTFGVQDAQAQGRCSINVYSPTTPVVYGNDVVSTFYVSCSSQVKQINVYGSWVGVQSSAVIPYNNSFTFDYVWGGGGTIRYPHSAGNWQSKLHIVWYELDGTRHVSDYEYSRDVYLP